MTFIKLVCCKQIETELKKGLIWKTTLENGKDEYRLRHDSDYDECYYLSEPITYCPFCGIPLAIIKMVREESIRK